jgi:hypothetical protein
MSFKTVISSNGCKFLAEWLFESQFGNGVTIIDAVIVVVSDDAVVVAVVVDVKN